MSHPSTRSSRPARPLLLLLFVLAASGSSARASVIPRVPPLELSYSEDFSDLVFVVYRLPTIDPWAPGRLIDPDSAKVVEPGKEAQVFSAPGPPFTVLAVPRRLAEQAHHLADPAWLESDDPEIIRVHRVFEVPTVYSGVALRYRLEKTEDGPRLKMLNRAEVDYARNEPYDISADIQAPAPAPEPSFWTQPGFLWGSLGGAAVGLLLGAWLARPYRKPAANPPT